MSHVILQCSFPTHFPCFGHLTGAGGCRRRLDRRCPGGAWGAANSADRLRSGHAVAAEESGANTCGVRKLLLPVVG